MTLIWFLASKSKALFFGDSGAFSVPTEFYENLPTSAGIAPNYEMWSKVVSNPHLTFDAKIIPIGKKIVVLNLFGLMKNEIMRFKPSDNVLEFTIALRKFTLEYIKKHGYLSKNLCAFTKFVFGYNESEKRIEVYVFNVRNDREKRILNSDVQTIPLPNCGFLSASKEPIELLKSYINSDKPIEHEMKKMLENAQTIFNEINKKYPLYIKPLHIAQLDRMDFKWLQHQTTNIKKQFVEIKKGNEICIFAF